MYILLGFDEKLMSISGVATKTRFSTKIVDLV